jgi:hypothetical protein
MVPFAAIIATYGIRQLAASRHAALRMFGLTVTACLPLTFALFYAHLV